MKRESFESSTMGNPTMEERLNVLERELNEVKERLGAQSAPKPNPWLDQVFGAFKDDPLFEEAVKHGREWRDSQNIIEA